MSKLSSTFFIFFYFSKTAARKTAAVFDMRADAALHLLGSSFLLQTDRICGIMWLTRKFRQYRTTPVRQITRKLNKVELRFFVRVHKFDAGGRAKTNSLFARQGKFVCYDGKYASR
jgi:hypothetical protein